MGGQRLPQPRSPLHLAAGVVTLVSVAAGAVAAAVAAAGPGAVAAAGPGAVAAAGPGAAGGVCRLLHALAGGGGSRMQLKWRWS